MYDELLKSFGLDYEQLDTPGHTGERDTMMSWLMALKSNALTVEKIRDYIGSMKDSVEKELVNTPEMETSWLFFQRPNRKAVLLKARLQNYMELYAFLTTPERAEEAIKQKLEGLKSKVSYD